MNNKIQPVTPRDTVEVHLPEDESYADRVVRQPGNFCRQMPRLEVLRW